MANRSMWKVPRSPSILALSATSSTMSQAKCQNSKSLSDSRAALLQVHERDHPRGTSTCGLRVLVSNSSASFKRNNSSFASTPGLKSTLEFRLRAKAWTFVRARRLRGSHGHINDLDNGIANLSIPDEYCSPPSRKPYWGGSDATHVHSRNRVIHRQPTISSYWRSTKELQLNREALQSSPTGGRRKKSDAFRYQTYTLTDRTSSLGVRSRSKAWMSSVDDQTSIASYSSILGMSGSRSY